MLWLLLTSEIPTHEQVRAGGGGKDDPRRKGKPRWRTRASNLICSAMNLQNLSIITYYSERDVRTKQHLWPSQFAPLACFQRSESTQCSTKKTA